MNTDFNSSKQKSIVETYIFEAVASGQEMLPLFFKINLVWACRIEGDCNDSAKKSLYLGKQNKRLLLARKEPGACKKRVYCL